tara:strand:+ start:146 stop:505 length:360 start_codon:yes stop_codon:yes gene_type:complete
MRDDRKMTDMPAALSQAIAGMRLRFIDTIEEKILHLEAALADLRSGNDPIEAARKIEMASHSLAGLAPSLGFADIGAAAVTSEMAWSKALEERDSDPALQAALDAVEALMDRLEAELPE